MSLQYPAPAHEGPGLGGDILAVAREQVLEGGDPLTQAQILKVLQIPGDRLGELLALAHEVRLKWCGPEAEVEGIVSLKTGGCPEDCHFCSQSGQFSSPVRSVWLDIPELVEAARRTRATGATEFCIVAAVRGPDARLMAQWRAGAGDPRGGRDQRRGEPGHPQPGAGRRAGRHGRAPLQP